MALAADGLLLCLPRFYAAAGDLPHTGLLWGERALLGQEALGTDDGGSHYDGSHGWQSVTSES
ncbi:hypothetical protein Aglo03_35290 [Actinokineospora globicatena]|uniref:Uncharacterized protein n=1 Tax=Actinokineospora globicatena TaxID=103729 RepID=A0A9W6QQA7_9PSEU|nr:hypothetical protein Aglo03_35290 [Actinokineospora globicatena]